MLIFLFRDQIKKAVGDLLKAYPNYPEGPVGLEEREQRIAILDGQIQKAEKELKELQQELKEAGVQTIPRPARKPNYSGGVPLNALPEELRAPHHIPGKVTERPKPEKEDVA